MVGKHYKAKPDGIMELVSFDNALAVHLLTGWSIRLKREALE